MPGLDSLIQDVILKRGKLNPKDGDGGATELVEVWNTFLRYLQSCLDQRRGLHINIFARIGWQLERKRQGGKVVYKPFFQFTEQFARAHLAPEACKKHVSSAANDLSSFEDFNYSKAAIKFSNQLTKDQVFGGLRALFQRLGDAVSEGKEVDLGFGDVGRFVCRGDRDPRFVFAAELYNREDLEAPPGIVPEGNQRSSSSFRRDVPEEAQDLRVCGNTSADQKHSVGGSLPRSKGIGAPVTLPLSSLQEYGMQEQEGTWQDYAEHAGYGDDTVPARRLVSSGSAPSLGSPGRTSALTATQYKKEVAFKEAMDRHISTMEARAGEAMAEREAWRQHVQGCLEQERDEIQERRMRAQMNLHFLKHQMVMGEERRKEQRKEDIVCASAHNFPKFEERAESEIKEFVHGQQARMRADLDEQVRTNNTLRNLAKQRERTMEVSQLEANKREMAMLRNAEHAKKAYDREALATAWNSEIRMKNIWKAIESHNKVGSHPPQVLLTESIPPSRGGSAASAGRLMTGSSRRVPLGASHSLTQLEARVGSSRPVL